MSKIKITQIKSTIDRLEKQKRTIKALGLGRPNYFVIRENCPQIMGMVNVVKHLVTVEEIKG
ncbi:MAG: 50S ribosomal protein L30 [Candidatus Kapabacteria bacterium]|nr:50S ribosomal protein L30 [Candidatus Kapabacteria bacterium]MBX7153788.1 50S ribosomal protein L30 [Bacteroidota bacterium]